MSSTPRFAEGRLAAPPTELIQRMIIGPGVMLLKDPQWFTAELTVDLAHTVMLAEQGIITRENASAICGALLKALENGPESIHLDTSRDGTLFQIEAYLSEEIGPDVAGRMHTGRSRTDRDATIGRLYLRNQLLDVVEALLQWQEALLKKGEEHYDTVLPGYTHLQAAQPITFGHHLMGQFWLHVDDLERLELAYKHANVSALGTASLAGTSWPLDRERTRELVGFDSCTENARVSRTYIYAADITGAYATLMATLHYLISDLYVWASHEFRMVETADEHSGSSSIMPQKKNPEVWEHIRVIARHAGGWTSSALAALMGASSSDSFLLPPEIQRYGPLVAGLLKVNTEVLERMKVDKQRMLELVREDFSAANDLADLLVRERGLSYREAHGMVGRLVRLCIEQQRTPDQADSTLLDQAAREVGVPAPDLGDSAVKQALDPVHFVHTRVTRGGANPEDVLRQVELGRSILEGHRSWLRAARGRVEEADAELRRAIARLTP